MNIPAIFAAPGLRGMIVSRRLALRRAVAALTLALLGACGGPFDNVFCFECRETDDHFFASTAMVVDPPNAQIVAGGAPIEADVKVIYAPLTRGEFSTGPIFYALDPANVTVVDPQAPGVTANLTFVAQVPCLDTELPLGWTGAGYLCANFKLTVTATSLATSLAPITISAQWRGAFNGYLAGNGGQVIERLGTFTPYFPGTPDFDLGVVPLGKVYATRGFVQVAVNRRSGFNAPVQLSLDGFASGITGVFTPNPVPPGVASAQLQLEVPAGLAGGTFTQLKVLGTGGGLDRSWQFGQLVDPLYTVTLATSDGSSPAVLTPLRPLDLQVTIAFDPYGPFSLIGPGPLQLSLPDPPPDVTVEFLPDARPGSLAPPVFPAGLVYTRTLRLTGPRVAAMDDLRVRATAVSLPPDLAMQQPFVEGKLPLRLDPSLSWDYLNSGAAYFLNANDAIGIGMQSNNQPAIAWMEGPAGGNKEVFLKRFDGTTFTPAPFPGGPGTGLSAAGGRMEQARMAMSRSDVAYVAYTCQVGTQEDARAGLGSAGAVWSAHAEVILSPAAQHARSPRVAAGFNDALALSYLVETGIPAGAGSLFVRGRLVPGSLAALPGPRVDESINVADSGQVVRDTPSLALGADGNPWLAWLEAPFDPVTTLPPALWLRGHDGTRWGAAIAVPTLRPLVAAPTQLLATQTGTLIVAWLEASPARLMLAYVDPVTRVVTGLRDASNPDGAMNYSSSEPARDVALTLDAGGRLVVAWTEGLTRPALHAKRLNADGTWTLLGTAIDASRPTRSPFVTSDVTGQLYVVWTGFFAGTDIDSLVPQTDVLVGRWIFP